MAGRAKCEEVMGRGGGEYRSGMKGSCLSERKKKKRMKKHVGKKKRRNEG